MKNINRPFLIAVVLVVLMGVGFAVYYYQSGKSLAAEKGTVIFLTGRVSTLEREVAAANSQASGLYNQLVSASANISALQGRLSSAESQMRALQSDLTAARSQVTSLQGEVAAGRTRVASLQAELDAEKRRAAALQSELSVVRAADIVGLQEQLVAAQQENIELKAIVDLSRSQLVADSVTVVQQVSGAYRVANFTAKYAGYVVITGISTSRDIYMTVTSTFPGYPYNETRYEFGTGTTLTIPVLPGTITVSYHNGRPDTTSTGTLYVRYVY